MNIIHVGYRGYNLWFYEDLGETFSRKTQIFATKVTVTPNWVSSVSGHRNLSDSMLDPNEICEKLFYRNVPPVNLQVSWRKPIFTSLY